MLSMIFNALVLVFLISVVFLYYKYIAHFHRVHLFGKVRKPDFKPSNTPVLNLTEYFLGKNDRYMLQLLKLRKLPIVVCLGDSITHGIVSTDYISLLQQKYQGRLLFINSGINGNLAYNLHQRLTEDCIEYNPDFITILIGTNDVNSHKDKYTMQRYIRFQKLPCTPDMDFYLQNLQAIIEKLKQTTHARIAILSLPVIGEELDSSLNQLVCVYSARIQEMAKQYNIAYLPLNEMQFNFLAKIEQRMPARYRVKSVLINLLLMLNSSFDRIAEVNGRYLTYDGLHETTQGAAMITELIDCWLAEGLAKGKE